MPATIEDLIISQEAEMELEKRRRERSLAEIKAILASARQEGRANVTAQEDEDIKRAQETAASAKVNMAGIEHKLDISKRTKAAELEVDQHLAERSAPPVGHPEGSKPAYDRVARVGTEERTYRREVDRKGAGFVRDVVRQFLYRDIEAEQRLSRHMQEERVERGQYLERAVGTGAFAGLTVPQYLTDMYAPAVAALRPFADQCNSHDLPPDGMVVNISQITTPTGVGLQASENSAVTEANIDDTILSFNVQTAAGQQTMSRQAIDRGTGIEEIVMDDLYRRYATNLDSTLINQAATGLAAVTAGQTYTDATPTGPKVYSQMVGAMSTVEGTLLGWAQPDLAIMASRRWYKLLSAVSSTWPMIYAPNGPVPVQGTGVNNSVGYAKGIRGQLANGLSVVVDANVSTLANGTATTGGTQDHIYVVASQECHLWEDPSAPVFIRAEQAQTLGVTVVLYGYFAYCFNRFPSGSSVKINGTGLAAPIFDGT
jgi:hypothetical protein